MVRRFSLLVGSALLVLTALGAYVNRVGRGEDQKTEDSAAVPIVFEAKRADSLTSGGNAIWDNKPLGRILWRAVP